MTAESLVDFRNFAALDGEKAKSQPKEKKFEKKPMKTLSRKPSGGKGKEDRPRPEGRPTCGQNSNSLGCFICDRPHRERDCLKLEKLAALVTKEDSDSDSPPRVNPLQLLEALRAVKGTSQPLLYVLITLNGREIYAMVDTGATHNFVCHNTTVRLELCVGAHSTRVKAINSKA